MPYGTPPPQGAQTNGLAVTALILGILSIPLAFACGIGGLLAIAAIIIGFIGRSKANKEMGGNGAGMALAGIITGFVGLAMIIAAYLLLWGASTAIDTNLDNINSDPSDGVCDESRFLQDPDC